MDLSAGRPQDEKKEEKGRGGSDYLRSLYVFALIGVGGAGLPITAANVAVSKIWTWNRIAASLSHVYWGLLSCIIFWMTRCIVRRISMPVLSPSRRKGVDIKTRRGLLLNPPAAVVICPIWSVEGRY